MWRSSCRAPWASASWSRSWCTGASAPARFYEVIYFLPVTSTLIAMATVWQFVLHPRLGPVNALLRMIGFGEIAFLSEPSLALPTLAVIGIWQLVGFNMVLFLAGLSAIPRDLYEAAEIDGCANGDRPLPDHHLAAARPDDDVRDRHHHHHRLQGLRHGGRDDARRPDGLVRGPALRDLPRRLSVLPHRLRRRADGDLPRCSSSSSRSSRPSCSIGGCITDGAAPGLPAARTSAGAALRRAASLLLVHAFLLAGAVFMLLPFVWMLVTSIKPPAEVFNAVLSFWPKRFYGVENYAFALTQRAAAALRAERGDPLRRHPGRAAPRRDPLRLRARQAALPRPQSPVRARPARALRSPCRCRRCRSTSRSPISGCSTPTSR